MMLHKDKYDDTQQTHTREALVCMLFHNWKKLPTPKPSLTSTGRMTGHKKDFVYTKGQWFKQQKLSNTKFGESIVFDVV